MEKLLPKFLIGIDLGTTNCTLAYAQQEGDQSNIEQLPIAQIISQSTQGESFTLPSFLYFPLEEELKAKNAALSWDQQRTYCTGVYARQRGGEMPSRLISSAKSWLCHSGIDRRGAILPLSDDEALPRMSPLTACSEFLRHLKEAWDEKQSHPFIEQQILITVPASFDPSARQLVQEAAEKAGYPETVLLEEPQAAFYAWMHRHTHDWREMLKVGDTILVVDIGGGTTDFSLIGVGQNEGDLTLERIAVGAHLLLGGDNIDLSLAYLARTKLEEQGHDIDEWQMQSLVHSCRQAKEVLLGENPPKSVDITIMGRGSRLIGGSLTTSLSLEEALKIVLEGFAPIVEPTERSKPVPTAGLQQLGLPYVKDPRLTAQLAKFLSMTGEADSPSMDQFIVPTAILFNGGTTKALALRERLIEQLNSWAKKLGKPSVKELPDADYDFAVSRGAVNYGLARAGKAIRIRSGTNRSYFIGIEDAAPAVPGFEPVLKAICIAPFGMEEGSALQLNGQEFSLVLGEQASFRFFSHATPKLSDGTLPEMGTVVKKWKQELTELHPIETILERGNDEGKTVLVKLESRVTELGVLEVYCVAADGRKWKLEFDIR